MDHTTKGLFKEEPTMKHLVFQTCLSMMAVFVLSSCGEKEEIDIPLKPRLVHDYTIQKSQPTLNRAFSGQIKVAEGTSISFEVSGRIQEVKAKSGGLYKKGDLLAKLYNTDFQIQFDDAKAKWVEAQQALKRIQKLFETSNTSKSQLDSSIAQELSTRSAHDLAKKKLDDCQLIMPYNGVIGTVEIEAQQFIQAGQQAMSIQGEGAMEFIIGLPTEVINLVQPGMESQIKLSHLNSSLKAKINEISPQISRNTTYEVTLILDEKIEGLRDGMDGQATLTLPNPRGNIILAPSSAILALPNGENFVWILKETPSKITVHRQKVKIGQLREGGQLEIISGVSPGDRIASKGVHRIEEGMTVSLAAKN